MTKVEPKEHLNHKISFNSHDALEKWALLVLLLELSINCWDQVNTGADRGLGGGGGGGHVFCMSRFTCGE